MSGSRDRDRAARSEQKGSVRRSRRKQCQFCVAQPALVIDYKNVTVLRQYMDDRARIRKARQTGTCRRHQNRLATAIKRAREMALLPYVAD